MGVIDIKNFWSVLKVSWFKRALDTEDVWVDYLKLLLREQGINDLTIIFDLGDVSLRHLGDRINHPFWKDAFNALADVKLGYHLSHQERLFQSPIFETQAVARDPGDPETCFRKIDFQDLAQHVSNFQDLRVGNTIKCLQDLELENVRPNNFVGYHSIFTAFRRTQDWIQDPIYPNKTENFKEYIQKSKGTSGFRKIIQISQGQTLRDFQITHTWEEKMGIELDDNLWKNAFSKFYKFWIEPKFKYLQFRLINRILGTNHLVARFDPNIEDTCTFCNMLGNNDNEETISHLFFQCTPIQQLWTEIAQWEPMEKLGFRNNIEDILIYANKPGFKHQYLLNSAIIWIKFYIWSCKKSHSIPSPEGAKRCVLYESVVLHHLLENKKGKSDFDIFENPERFSMSEGGYFRNAILAVD